MQIWLSGSQTEKQHPWQHVVCSITWMWVWFWTQPVPAAQFLVLWTDGCGLPGVGLCKHQTLRSPGGGTCCGKTQAFKSMVRYRAHPVQYTIHTCHQTIWQCARCSLVFHSPLHLAWLATELYFPPVVKNYKFCSLSWQQNPLLNVLTCIIYKFF